MPTTIKNNTNYYYKVIANNVVGDTWDYSNPNLNNGAEFPSKDVMSNPSNVAIAGCGPDCRRQLRLILWRPCKRGRRSG